MNDLATLWYSVAFQSGPAREVYMYIYTYTSSQSVNIFYAHVGLRMRVVGERDVTRSQRSKSIAYSTVQCMQNALGWQGHADRCDGCSGRQEQSAGGGGARQSKTRYDTSSSSSVNTLTYLKPSGPLF